MHVEQKFWSNARMTQKHGRIMLDDMKMRNKRVKGKTYFGGNQKGKEKWKRIQSVTKPSIKCGAVEKNTKQ
jgi:hypothetical protein